MESAVLVPVQKSLMPKGVDHCARETARKTLQQVQKSLMPKGVDHLKPANGEW